MTVHFTTFGFNAPCHYTNS